MALEERLAETKAGALTPERSYLDAVLAAYEAAHNRISPEAVRAGAFAQALRDEADRQFMATRLAEGTAGVLVDRAQPILTERLEFQRRRNELPGYRDVGGRAKSSRPSWSLKAHLNSRRAR